MRIFGISIGTIILLIAAIALGRSFGSKIPLISSLAAG